MSAADKSLLEQRLAKILSINIDDDHDYVSDVLDSLVDIGDPDDVAEYLSSFVAGGDCEGGDDLQKFSQDVRKFKLGENISHAPKKVEGGEAATAAAASMEAKPKAKVLDEGAARREEIKRREIEARERQREEQERSVKKKEEEERRQREAAEAAAEAAEAKMNQPKPRSGKMSIAGQQDGKPNIMQPSSHKSTSDAKKRNPSKGQSQQSSGGAASKNKPKIQRPQKKQHKSVKGKPEKSPCGCYGNKHKPLANCLHCGRISCEVEGVDDHCHFCGHLIENFASDIVSTGDEKNDAAIRHKERLLQFDREFAQRTHIHDDQEDYFVASTSMWATEQEQTDAREMEEVRKEKLHQRQGHTLKINF